MSRQMIIAALAAALGLGAWYFTQTSSNQSTSVNADSVSALVGSANAQSSDADIDTSSVIEMTMGNPDAPVTVIEYASYTCPHCGNFHAGPYKQLKADYIDSGKINFVYREVYFDRYGLWASAIARCAGPEKFFGMTDLIYAGQSEWSRADSPADIVDGLRKIGRLAGLGSEQIEACLQDQDNLRTLVAWYKENAQKDGITSTPSFVINGKTYANMAYDEMKRLIDEAAGS